LRRTKPFRWREVREVAKPDKKNKEEIPAYSGTPEMDLVNVLMIGTTANTFYVSGWQLAEEMIQVLQKYLDTKFLAKAIIYAREQGYRREPPVVGEVVLSTKDLNLFRQTIHRVCKTPTDWQKFIDVCRSGMIRKGLGRALKEEIVSAIANMSVYHAMKYPKAVEDMINIARPHESVNPAVIRYIKRKDHTGDEQLEALWKLKHTSNEDEIVRIIEEGRLPYEVVTGSVTKITPRIWEALLYQAPYMNLLRNLNNFARYEVFNHHDNVEYAVRKLINNEAIRQAKVLPFRFYVAHRMLRREYFDNSWHYEQIAGALEKALETSVINVPELDGNVCIAPDVSGSMGSRVMGEYSVLQCYDIVGIFTAMMIKKCKKVPVVLPFDSKVRLDVVEKLMQKETIMEMAKCFGAWGATSMSAPVEYLINENIDVDVIISFTDNEEWVGRGFIDAFMDYRRRVNPECKAYLVTLLPYRDYPTPQIPGVHYIFGWSDAVIRYIATDPEEQMKEIVDVNL